MVTPASRGIGLELARRVLRCTQLPVVATARTSLDSVREAILSSRPLESYTNTDTKGQRLTTEQARAVASEGDASRLHVLPLDVTDEASIAAAADECASLFGTPGKQSSDAHLHLALVLPGILHPEKSPAQLEYDAVLDTFRVNTIGPLMLLKHFARFLPRKNTPLDLDEADAGFLPRDHATWATFSARVGSIGDNSLGGWYSYRASKAGVNQITKTFDNYLRVTSAEQAMAISMHPGTVKTGLSKEFWANVKEEKLFRPGYAADKLCEVIRGLDVESARGRCWDWKGTEVPP